MTPTDHCSLLTFHSAAGGLAHLVQTGFGGFYDGIAHWALSPRDVLVTLAVAILAGLGGRPHARTAVLALPTAWAVAGMIGFRFPGIGDLPLATTLTLGIIALLAALHRIPPPAFCAAVAVIAGAIHGLANGSVMAADERPPLALAGTVTAVAVVVLLASAAVAPLKKPAARITARVAASWLAATAILLLGWLFRPDA